VEIRIDQGRIVVSGEVRRNEEVKQENSFRISRRHGRFQQCLPLPSDIKNESPIGATLMNGILRVTVPLSKSIQEKSKPIEVKVE